MIHTANETAQCTSPTRPCPACLAGDAARFSEVNGYLICRCAGCGTLFAGHPPDEEALGEIYQRPEYHEMDDWSRARIEKENRRRLSLARRFVAKGRVLDIGCATGEFLDLARANFETYGIEPSRRNGSIAAGKGHDVFVGSFAEYLQRNAALRFELVVCLDVIEHLLEPRAFLREAAKLVAPGGLLVLSTPNYSGLVARVLGERDPFMTPPEHLSFFTLAGMRNMCRAANLSIVRVETFGTLNEEEIRRGMRKHLPPAFGSLPRVGVPLMSLAFKLLNAVKSGLELECYAIPDAKAS